MRKIKYLLSLALIAALLASLCACGQSTEPGTADTESNASDSPTEPSASDGTEAASEPGDAVDLISYFSVTVRMADTQDEFAEVIDANVGDEVEFQIEYRNLGTTGADNVMIRDILPDNMEYVANSTYLYNSTSPDGAEVTDDALTTSGINIGSNYQPQADAYIRFRAKVVNNDLASGTTQMVNWANVTVGQDVVKDDASVMVTVP